MASIIVSIHPKEVETIRKELDLVDFPTITIHSSMALEFRQDKPAPKPDSRFILMRTDSIKGIQDCSGTFIEVITEPTTARQFLIETFDEMVTGRWLKDTLTDRAYFAVTCPDFTGYAYLIPIE